jgi:hypothetical protein
MNHPHIIERFTNPNIIPPKVGIHWINKSTNQTWFSVGTSSINDWQLMIDSASFNLDGGEPDTQFGGTTKVDAGEL